MYNQPPVDLTVHAIITKALPPYRLTLRRLLGNDRIGRAPSLTTMQESFKRAWEHLAKVPIKGTYVTDTKHWTCDCGAQKYHAYLLCKHLVQATCRPPASWWASVQRFHIPPFYTVPISGTIAPPLESTLNHSWLSCMPQTRATDSGASRAMMQQHTTTSTKPVGPQLEPVVITILDSDESEAESAEPEKDFKPVRDIILSGIDHLC